MTSLEGTLIQHSKNTEALRTPVEILKEAKETLNWTDDDVNYLAATYIKRDLDIKATKDLKQNYGDINLRHYTPKNYDKEAYAKYKLGLSYVEAARLDFQIIMSTICNEKLLREYITCKYQYGSNNVKHFGEDTYTGLIDTFVTNFHIHRPNGRTMELDGKAVEIETDKGIKWLDSAKFHGLIHEMSRENTAQEMIDIVLNNFYKYYYLNNSLHC